MIDSSLISFSNSETLNYRYTGKVILLGDSGTGKTSLFNKIIGRGYCKYTPPTIGVDFHSVSVKIDSKFLPLDENYNKIIKNLAVKLQIWDAAGQEKFRKIVKSYYTNASIIILVFDLSNRTTFEHLTDWITEIGEAIDLGTFPIFFLVGNKTDLNDNQISKEEIESFRLRNNILSYFPLSARLDDERIVEFIIKIGHELYNYVEIHKQDQVMIINSHKMQILENRQRTDCCLLL